MVDVVKQYELKGSVVQPLLLSIVFDAAEIIRRKDYLGTPIFDQAWAGSGSALRMDVDSFEQDDTAIGVHTTVHTSIADQPMRDFLNDAIAVLEADQPDVRYSVSQNGPGAFVLIAKPRGEAGSDINDIKAWWLTMGALSDFTLIAPS